MLCSSTVIAGRFSDRGIQGCMKIYSFHILMVPPVLEGYIHVSLLKEKHDVIREGEDNMTNSTVWISSTPIVCAWRLYCFFSLLNLTLPVNHGSNCNINSVICCSERTKKPVAFLLAYFRRGFASICWLEED